MALRSRTSSQVNTRGFQLSYLQDIFMATHKCNWLWKTCQTAALFISCHCPKESCYDTPTSGQQRTQVCTFEVTFCPCQQLSAVQKSHFSNLLFVEEIKAYPQQSASKNFWHVEASQLCWLSHVLHQPVVHEQCSCCYSSKFKALSLPTKLKNRSLCFALIICFCVQDAYVFPLNPKRKLWPGWSCMHWEMFPAHN